MSRAKLHIICGNCGCNDEFNFEIDPKGHDYSDEIIDFRPAVFITCGNCGSIHDLSTTINEKDTSIKKNDSMNMSEISFKKEINLFVLIGIDKNREDAETLMTNLKTQIETLGVDFNTEGSDENTYNINIGFMEDNINIGRQFAMDIEKIADYVETDTLYETTKYLFSTNS